MDKEAVEKHLESIVSEGFTPKGSRKFATAANNIATQYLRTKLSNAEIQDIAQDALSSVIAKTYAINKKGSSENPFEDTSHVKEDDSYEKSVSTDSANSSSELLSSINQSEASFNKLDDDNIISLLKAKKIENDKIDIILRHLSGESFVDMATNSDSSPDKFRKAYSRAIEKAGIELEELKRYK